jgi:hypothetical protein
VATPTTREEFKEYCLRKLGKGVLQINVSDEQVEDRIDEALLYFHDYHFDGAEHSYFKHQVTQLDKDNKYIELDDDEGIIGVVRVFPIGDPAMRSDDIFNIRYQIALNDLYNLTSVSMVPYYLAMEHLALIQEILVGKQPIDFNRKTNRIYPRMGWEKVAVGEYLLFEVYRKLDVDEYSTIWGDRWLQNYATALIKEQWGTILTKFKDVKLTSGNVYNGEKILEDAQKEREKLEDRIHIDYELPPTDFVG